MAIAFPLPAQLVSNVRSRPATRVLFFNHTAALGGGEIALANLVSHLDRTKIKPLVVLAADGALVGRLRPIAETYVLPLPTTVTAHRKDRLGIATLLRVRDALSVLKYVRQLARFIRFHNVTIVHTNSLKADIIGGLAARQAGRPVVWHVRDRIEDDYLPKSVVRTFRLLARLIPTYVIANSAATLRTLRPQSPRNTSIPPGIEPGERTGVVYDGTGPAAFAGKTHSSREFHVGLVGRISPWKGQHIFIQAAALVHRQFPDARFYIVGAALFGEDQYEQEVRRLLGQLQIESIVEFTGFRNDVKSAIASLDLVVHASTKGEPFGQVIIEGMAAGKPVVATDGGGVPEIVEDGQTGILVPMGDLQAMAHAICKILSDPERARVMGVRARKRIAEQFTLDQTARKVEEIYAEVLR